MQRRYPEALHDYTEYDNLIRNLRAIENKKSIEIYAKNYFDDLVVIYQGNMLKYGRSQKNTDPLKLKDNHTFELMIQPIEDHGLKGFTDIYDFMEDAKQPRFKYIDFQFTNDTQIIKLIETAEKDVIQIFAEDYHSEIITVVTWDFLHNIEKTMFQIQPDYSDFVGNHIVKGMNYKCNYFVNQHYVTDMEYNVPIRQKNVD